MRTGKRSRAHLLLITVAASAALVTACATGGSGSPQNLAEQTRNVVLEITGEENEVFIVLDENLRKVQQLSDAVRSTQDSSAMRTKVVEELEQVTRSFERAAKNKDEVSRQLQARIDRLKELRAKANQEMASLEQRKAVYQAQLQSAMEKEGEIARISQETRAQAIEYIDQQIDVWSGFIDIHQAIEAQAEKMKPRVEIFIAMIEGNALLYREVSNLLKLHQDIPQALTLFTEDLPEIERLSREMEEDRSKLDSLVNSLLAFTGPSSSD